MNNQLETIFRCQAKIRKLNDKIASLIEDNIELKKENNRLEVQIDSFCARYGYDVEELNG